MNIIRGWRTALIGGGFGIVASFACAADLEVEVRGVRPNAGPIYVALFDSPEDFKAVTTPRASVSSTGEITTGIFTSEALMARPAKERLTVPPNARTVRFRFTDIEPGVYAVALYQDLNNDARLDTSLSGNPLEPWGLSNNPKLPDRAATWDEVRFTLPAAGLRLDIELQR